MKIAVLVSGGVDSSVALRLLKEQGHDLTAFYLKIWLEDELSYLGDCPWEEDLSYARRVCDQLNVPLQVVSLQEEYWSRVVAYTIEEIKAGRTPSPDIMCNQQVKFGAFFDKIDQSYEKVATGHYAQLVSLHSPFGLYRDERADEQRQEASVSRSELFALKKANDPIKDQTYFLSHLSQAQLSRALFPIGHLLKSELRELAEKFGLATQARKDSQGICFLGKIKFSDFIKHHLGEKPGNFIEVETGKKVGTHKGFWFHTIGQRKGIGLGGGPWYVVAKDLEKNIVYISKEYYSEEKIRDQFDVHNINWILGTPPNKRDLHIKLRHGENVYQATLDLKDAHAGHVTINGNDQGIAPGQFAVFYDGDICLGSGQIE